MRKPSIKKAAIANRHARDGETIAEFTIGGKGGLLAMRRIDDDRERLEIYRCDPGIEIVPPSNAVLVVIGSERIRAKVEDIEATFNNDGIWKDVHDADGKRIGLLKFVKD